MGHIHSKGLVHTDIKLENILFTARSEKASVKVIDFGFCQPWTGKQVLRQKQGTLGYMAPEVIRGRYNNKCDISTGVVAFTLLCGKTPFGMNQRETTERRIIDDRYHFGRGWDGVSDLAKDFVTRLLANDPKQRISAAKALQHPWLVSHPRELVWSNASPYRSASLIGGTSEASTRAGASSVELGRVSS